MPPQTDVGDYYPLQADNRRNVFITVDKIGFKNSKLIESFVDPIITIYIVCEGVALLILCRSSRTRARSHPPPFPLSLSLSLSLSLEAPFPFVPHHHAVDVEASRVKSRETRQPLCSYILDQKFGNQLTRLTLWIWSDQVCVCISSLVCLIYLYVIGPSRAACGKTVGAQQDTSISSCRHDNHLFWEGVGARVTLPLAIENILPGSGMPPPISPPPP